MSAMVHAKSNKRGGDIPTFHFIECLILTKKIIICLEVHLIKLFNNTDNIQRETHELLHFPFGR